MSLNEANSKQACSKARDAEQEPPRSEGIVPLPQSERGGKPQSGSGGDPSYAVRSTSERATTLVARRRSSSTRRSSERLACDSSTVRGPAP